MIPVTAPEEYIDLNYDAAKNEIQDNTAELPEEVTDIRTHLQENWSTMATQSCIAFNNDSAKAGFKEEETQMGKKKRSSETHTSPRQTTAIANPIDMMLSGGFFLRMCMQMMMS